MTSFLFMQLLQLAVILVVLPAQAAVAQENSVRAQQFPPGHFYRYQKAPMPEKAQILVKIDATLKKLNQDGYGLIAKGAVIDRMATTQKIYDRLTILDESGLIIVARHVPNLYYHYPDPSAINPNIYLILKNPRVNVPDSYIRYGFVVEGDYLAYVQKFVTAISCSLENVAPPPAPRLPKWAPPAR
jgi:hypothetical protein